MNIKEDIRMFKNNEIELVDTRTFEEYMDSHISESALATFYEKRWPEDMAEYIKNSRKRFVFLTSNENYSKKVRESLSTRGIDATIYLYSDFLKEGRFVETHAKNLTPDQFMEERDEWKVIDVREPYEWSSGHIEDAILMPMNELFQNYKNLQQNEKYVLVCEHGNRSMYSTMFLADRGYNVANIEGGMNELRSRGYIN